MAVNLSPLFNEQILTLAGVPASGYKLFTYAAGSTTKTNTYTTSAGNVANANPIVLDSNGYPSNGAAQVQIWLTAGTSYKFVLAPSTDTDPPTSAILTEDNITGVNDTVSSSITEWTASTFTGITFVSGTQFTVTGDQTALLTLNRRLKTTNTAGTIYSYISAVDYNVSNAGKTTVTVVNDSGTLDSGLSAVSYGIINPTNSSLFPSANPITWFGKQTLSGAALNLAADVTIASAATVNIGAAASNNVIISGTTTITAFDTVANGITRNVKFSGALTLTYNATSLILPGLANITTVANDTATFESLGSGNWICTSYTRASFPPAKGPVLLFDSGAISAAAGVAVTSVIDNTKYLEYEIHLDNLVPAAAAQLAIQVSSTNGAPYDSGARYLQSYHDSSTAGTGSDGGGEANTLMGISGATNPANTAPGVSGIIRFLVPSGAGTGVQSIFDITYTDGTHSHRVSGMNTYNFAAVVNAFNVFFVAQNISSGRFTVWGVAL